MNTMTIHSVVDRMSADLAERRRTAVHRHGAYLALACAILNDAQADLPTELIFDRNPASIAQAQAAA